MLRVRLANVIRRAIVYSSDRPSRSARTLPSRRLGVEGRVALLRPQRRSGGCRELADLAVADSWRDSRRGGRAVRGTDAAAQRRGGRLGAGKPSAPAANTPRQDIRPSAARPRRPAACEPAPATVQVPLPPSSALDPGRAVLHRRATARAVRRRPRRSAPRSIQPPAQHEAQSWPPRLCGHTGCRKRTGSDQAGSARTGRAGRPCSTRRCRRTGCADPRPRARSMQDRRSRRA